MMITVVKSNIDDSETRNLAGALTESEIHYLIIGAQTREEAFAAMRENVPTSIGEIPLSEFKFNSYTGDAMDMSALYRKSSGSSASSTLTPGKVRVSFDCTGGTRHVNYAIKTTVLRGTDEQKRMLENDNRVGWDGNPAGQIDGVDIPDANCRISFTRCMSYAEVTKSSYESTVLATVGKVNASAFKGRPAGSVMFLGISYSGEEGDDVDVTFHFQVQMPENIIFGGTQYGKKQGFEYVWIVPSKNENDKRPSLIVKSQLMYSANFGALQL